MPELPDVEVYKQHIDKTSLNKKIDSIDIGSAKLLKGISSTKLTEKIKGKRIQSTYRRGKYLFATINSNTHLLLHFGMTGQTVHVEKDDQIPRYTAMVLHFSKGDSLAIISKRKLGRIEVVNSIDSYIQQEKLGEDALSISEKDFDNVLKRSSSAVKNTLMNQSLLAGIGNIYADEILFQAHIDPRRPVSELDEKEIKSLYKKTKNVLKKAIQAKANPQNMPRSFLLPHRGADQKCPLCSGKQKKVKVSGRSTYFCPQCQK